MNLMGLSPEQIDKLTRTDVLQNANLVNAANALADRNSANYQTQAYSRAHAPDLIDVELDGKVYKIRRQDTAQALQAGATMRELPSKIAENWATAASATRSAGLVDPNADLVDMELDGKVYKIRRSDIAEAKSAGASMIRANVAQAESPHNIAARKTETAKNVGDISARQTQQAAIERLGNIQGPTDLTSPAHYADVVQAAPNAAISAQLNKAEDKGITDNQLRQYGDTLNNMSEVFTSSPDKVTVGETANYNMLAEKVGLTDAWVVEDGKATQIALGAPIGEVRAKLSSKGVTFQDIVAEAKRRDMTTQEFLPYVLRQLEGVPNELAVSY